MTPEFSRIFRLDEIGDVGRRVEIEADEAERRALSERFGLIEIGRLAATAELRRDGEIVTATGRIEADVVQACVPSGDPVPAPVPAGVFGNGGTYSGRVGGWAARPPPRRRRSNWPKASWTTSTMTARRSTWAKRLRRRWRWRSIPFRVRSERTIGCGRPACWTRARPVRSPP